MIINKDVYECPICRELYTFDTSKEYTAVCPECKCNLSFILNGDFDTKLAKLRKDKNSPCYIHVVECPYCSSVNISELPESDEETLMQFGHWRKNDNQWHCNKCGRNF